MYDENVKYDAGQTLLNADEGMIRILHSVSNMDRAGIETMLMNYYRHIDKTKFQFDFICNKSKTGDYDDEIRAMGGRIFLSPGLSPVKFPAYLRFIRDLLHDNPSIKILHGHNEAMAFYALEGAKKTGLPVRICHAHNTRIIRDYKWPLKILCKKLLPYVATDYWGCGTDAGEYYFGKKNWKENGFTLHNAIDLNKFGFDSVVRENMRKKYDLSDKYVIGNVGRFNVQKNHTRLLDIFKVIKKRNSNACLLLIGEGEQQEKMKQKAKNLGIQDSVFFLGLRSDVEQWYQAMDVFVLPSLFEGLPVVGIEAQASGLPCVYSDNVPSEAVILECSKRQSLSLDDEKWADCILACKRTDIMREKGAGIMRAAGYDIVEETRKLEELYTLMSKRK